MHVNIGGEPVTETYSHQIEAGGFSSDSSVVVNLVNKLLNNV
jgi:hypothetical protein